MAPMQGTRCLSLEVQIISARKDSVQTFNLSSKQKEKRPPVSLQPPTRRKMSSLWTNCELGTKVHTRFFLLHYIDMLQLLQRWMYVKQVCNLSVAAVTLFVLFSTVLIPLVLCYRINLGSGPLFFTWQGTNWHVAYEQHIPCRKSSSLQTVGVFALACVTMCVT